jgi:flavin reductase (DIM6/NTAB) family NADH-FMN oxidoreductase RutF
MKEITPVEGLDRLFPLSCVFVLSVDPTGKPSGMVASWFIQTSHNPPQVALSVGKKRYTCELIQKSREFVIAIPNKEMKKQVSVFGYTSGRLVDKFKQSKIKFTKGKYTKVPLLTEATFNYECKVVSEIETGDHILFIGDVVSAWTNEHKKVLLSMGYVNNERTFQEF